MKELRTREQKLAALEEYAKELDRQDALRSTGSTGKWYETVIRTWINKRVRAEDVHARKQSRSDMSNTTFRQVEIKTGCGVVAYGMKHSNLTEWDILPGAKWIFYAPFPVRDRTATVREIFETTYVFNRDQFIQMLLATSAKGTLQSATKQARKDVNIQEWIGKRESRWNDFINTHDEVVSLDEYFFFDD